MAISVGNAIPSAAARMEVAVAVPPVMATTETPTVSPDKGASARPDQGPMAAPGGPPANPPITAPPNATTSLRCRRLGGQRSHNHHRCERPRYPVQHLSALPRKQTKLKPAMRYSGSNMTEVWPRSGATRPCGSFALPCALDVRCDAESAPPCRLYRATDIGNTAKDQRRPDRRGQAR